MGLGVEFRVEVTLLDNYWVMMGRNGGEEVGERLWVGGGGGGWGLGRGTATPAPVLLEARAALAPAAAVLGVEGPGCPIFPNSHPTPPHPTPPHPSDY